MNLWWSLFLGKVGYATELLFRFSKGFKQWYKDYWYRGIKMLFGINWNPSKDRLLKAALGQPWECYTQ